MVIALAQNQVNQNADKHGHYSTPIIGLRRLACQLLEEARDLISKIELGRTAAARLLMSHRGGPTVIRPHRN
jgi:hypothetical protein